MNTVLNLVDKHTPEEVDHILSQSFYAFQTFGEKETQTKTHQTFYNLKKKLTHLGFIDGGLTEKGRFASNIYADEIIIGELFGTDLYKKLNEYQIMLLLACVCYEGRERTKFHKKFVTSDIAFLRKFVASNDVLASEPRFKSAAQLTAIIHPCYHGASLFDIIPVTTLQEGDVVRFLRQIVDRTNQIKMATRDHHIIHVMEGCQKIIGDCLKDIDAI